jgi:hypothetical protein
MTLRETGLYMVDWELTATTIYCDDIADEVTIIVSRDGTAKCTGSQKYLKSDKESAKELKKKSKQLGKPLACKGEGCSRVARYRDELMSKK